MKNQIFLSGTSSKLTKDISLLEIVFDSWKIKIKSLEDLIFFR